MSGPATGQPIGEHLSQLIMDGPFESPLWNSFLEELKTATEADYAALNLRWRGRPNEEGIVLVAGVPAGLDIANLERQFFPDRAPPPAQKPPEGKPCSLLELERLDAGADADFFRFLRDSLGISALTQMRIQEASGVEAWLTIVRHENEFSHSDASLLESLGSALRNVLRLYVTQERYRYAASITADAAARLSFGWMVLDQDGAILDCDTQAQVILDDKTILKKDSNGRLIAANREVQGELAALIQTVAQSEKPRARAIQLCDDPWFDLLVTRARRNSVTASARPAVIAYIHGDSWSTTDRCEQLAELFALYPREAQLALALSRGMTIAEAAKEFGLTEGTARVYTKSIYAKTGARGLPDLVRIVMRSVLAFAPDPSGG